MLNNRLISRCTLLLVGLSVLLISCSPPTETTTIVVPTGSNSATAETSASPAATAANDARNRLSTIRNMDWRLHNLDLAGSRYSPSDQIRPDNVAELTPAWLFQHGVIDGVSNQTTLYARQTAKKNYCFSQTYC